MSRRGLLGAVRAGARDLRGRDRVRGDGGDGQHRLLQRDRARKIRPQVMTCNDDIDKHIWSFSVVIIRHFNRNWRTLNWFKT